jgi:hypothetical protein
MYVECDTALGTKRECRRARLIANLLWRSITTMTRH